MKMKRTESWVMGAASAVLLGASLVSPASAADAPAAPVSFLDSLKFSGWVEGGYTVNPSSNVNFGSLMTAPANKLLLNQAVIGVEKDIDPAAEGFDWGFKIQGMYGTDARIVHTLGIFDRSINDSRQADILEADISLHLPVLTEGGVDLKIGNYPTPLGAEVIAAGGNQFYSHSYIFNFGLPFKHTGGYATIHLNPTVDLYAGADTGTNTSFGHGDNNGNGALLAGIGLNNLLDGELTVLALTHIGPENPNTAAYTAALGHGQGINASHDMRYYNDIVVTFKPNQKWTYTTEMNYVQDDGVHAIAYGVSQYIVYAITDELSFGVRGEVFRDNGNFFVGYPTGNFDLVDFQRGVLDPTLLAATTATTYGEFTAGFNYRPAGLPEPLGLTVRPEVRVDTGINGTKPFNINGSNPTGDSNQVTFGVDAILAF